MATKVIRPDATPIIARAVAPAVTNEAA
jgi:hypothetical protein